MNKMMDYSEAYIISKKIHGHTEKENKALSRLRDAAYKQMPQPLENFNIWPNGTMSGTCPICDNTIVNRDYCYCQVCGQLVYAPHVTKPVDVREARPQ